ncbi:MAG: peptidoglycan D,D-transpeptidase FtsI family protein [Rickettsiales bacterium]
MLLKYKNMIRPTAKSVEDTALSTSRNRLAVVIIVVSLAFMILLYRLFDISLSSKEDLQTFKAKGTDFFVQRAAIEDRDGTLLAINLSTASLYANPMEIIDVASAANKLCGIFPNVNCKDMLEKLRPTKTFTWLKRHITPKEQQEVNDLGVPGLYFLKEEKRIYPHNNLFSHVLGFSDIDNNGISGVERYFDNDLKNNSKKPLLLSLDTRVQEALKEELQQQVTDHQAIGGSGIVMDVNTGEVLAMVCLPDFDPNKPQKASEAQRFNQLTLGVYEMGSTFKVFTTAMGLDGKFVTVNDAFDTSATVMVGNHKISDFRGKGGVLSVPEILMYSSNIGTAQIAQRVGVTKQKEYMRKFGFLSPMEIELPEKSATLYPSDKRWSNASLVTISYGHGISVTPMHVIRAFASVVNGGKLIKPTLLKVDEPQNVDGETVLKENTSQLMRKLLRLVVTGGSGRKANTEGYLVAGKTGTAEKIVGSRYSKNQNIALFICAFPIDDPKYAVLIMVDEAKRNALNGGFTTGGTLAAPVAGRVIERIAPILGVAPQKALAPNSEDVMALVYQARYKRN